MISDVRLRSLELIRIGNDIEDKLNQIRNIEQEVEKLQVYRNERGDQLLHILSRLDESTYTLEERV